MANPPVPASWSDLPAFLNNLHRHRLEQPSTPPDRATVCAATSRERVLFPLLIQEALKPIRPLTIRDKTIPITIATSPPSMMERTSTSIPTTTTKYLLIRVKLRIQSLRKEYEHALQLEESVSQGNSLSKEEQEVLRTMPAIYYCIGELKTLFALLVNANTSVSTACHAVLFCPFQERASMKDNSSEEIIDPVDPWDKNRYLCVSDGFTICCFDLKKEASEISTLRLPEEDFPVLLGLFKSGSSAFMVAGGQEMDSDLKGSRTHHLCVVDGSLHLSRCDNIRPLNKAQCTSNIKQPKFWPIVVKIGDHVHVIESLGSSDRLEIVSHEALNLSDPIRGWAEIPPVGFPKFKASSVNISRHIVIGHRMYASGNYNHGFVVFDSKKMEWEWHLYGRGACRSYYTIRHVAELMQIGFGSCIGEYVHGESGEPMYVVLAIGNLHIGKLIAVAYLVTSTGQVVCFQRLNRFFEGFSLPYDGLDASVVRVDEQQVCTIIRGYYDKSLIIGSCTWEESDEALALVSCRQEQQTRDVDVVDQLPLIDEEDFISVVVNGWHTCQLKNGPELESYYPFSACFV